MGRLRRGSRLKLGVVTYGPVNWGISAYAYTARSPATSILIPPAFGRLREHTGRRDYIYTDRARVLRDVHFSTRNYDMGDIIE